MNVKTFRSNLENFQVLWGFAVNNLLHERGGERHTDRERKRQTDRDTETEAERQRQRAKRIPQKEEAVDCLLVMNLTTNVTTKHIAVLLKY